MYGGVVSALLMRASATVTDGVLTEEDVLRRSRAASLDTVKHLTIYGAGSEHHTLPEDPRAPPPAHSLSPSDGLCAPSLLPRVTVCDVSIVSRLTRCEMLSLVGNQVVTADPAAAATGFAPTRGKTAHRVYTAWTPGEPRLVWLHAPHVHRWPRSRRLPHAPRSSSSSCVAMPSATWKRSHTHTNTIRVAASDAPACSLSALCAVLC